MGRRRQTEPGAADGVLAEQQVRPHPSQHNTAHGLYSPDAMARITSDCGAVRFHSHPNGPNHLCAGRTTATSTAGTKAASRRGRGGRRPGTRTAPGTARAANADYRPHDGQSHLAAAAPALLCCVCVLCVCVVCVLPPPSALLPLLLSFSFSCLLSSLPASCALSALSGTTRRWPGPSR